MIVSRKPYNKNEKVKRCTYNFDIVKDYTYLGIILINKNDLTPEIEKKITNPNRAYYALLTVLKSQSVLGAGKI
jgi:hypothetical protein